MEKKRVRILISGKVQGVFFRDSTKRKADILGLAGFVRNLSNGKVEVVAEGEKDRLKEIAKWCKRGPVSAKVENTEITREDYKKEFNNFTIL